MQVERDASHTSAKIARSLLLAMALFAPFGCSSMNAGVSIHQSAKGSVTLQEVTDWSFEASHPTIIDPATIAKSLRGVQSDDTQPGTTKLSAGGGKPMRVFSDEDVEFLAPLLAQALSHAKPEQIVGFRLSSSAGSGFEPTAGTLYAQRTSLYLTMMRYQGKSAKNSASTKSISFNPATAGRIETASTTAAQGQFNASTIIIDYTVLAAMAGSAQAPAKAAAFRPNPVPVAIPVSMTEQPMVTAVPSQSQDVRDIDFMNQKLDELRRAKETLSKKNTEISVLRKETDWMKRELRERDAELKALKSKKVSTKAAPKRKSGVAEVIIR